MKKGFATIYIVLILFSLTLTVLIIAEVASGFGAQSVAESIVTSAGESVLGRYNKALFKRYGIFALSNDEATLAKDATHFLSGSCIVTKGFVKLNLDKVYIYTDNYPCLNTDLFADEILKAVPESIVKSNSDITGREEHKVSSKNLPSKQLGYSSRESVLLSGGIFELEAEKFAEDEYILKMCSYKNGLKDDTYLAYEVEYILFGYGSDLQNASSMRRSVYAVFFAESMAKLEPLPTDPATLAVLTAKAALEAEQKTSRLVNGEDVDGKTYVGFLRTFLSLLSRDEKLARLMDIMQINLNFIDGENFNFKHYSFGFDMEVTFSKKVMVPVYWGNEKRNRTIIQTHTYK